MEISTIVLLVMLWAVSTAGLFAGHQWYMWRRTALSQRGGRSSSEQLEAKDQAYKDSFEAQLNALNEERRQQHVAMNEAFDYLNDNGPFGSHNPGLMQVRNVLLRAIQISTYGRG